MAERKRQPERRSEASHIAIDAPLAADLRGLVVEEKTRHDTADRLMTENARRMGDMEKAVAGMVKLASFGKGLMAVNALVILLIGALTGMFMWTVNDKNVDFRSMQAAIQSQAVLNATNADAAKVTAEALAGVVAEQRRVSDYVVAQIQHNTATVGKVAQKAQAHDAAATAKSASDAATAKVRKTEVDRALEVVGQEQQRQKEKLNRVVK